nr:MAG TPA: hypothetical protein [Caudoviricetes sp.]
MPPEGSDGLGLLVSSCTYSSITHDSGFPRFLRSPLLADMVGSFCFF